MQDLILNDVLTIQDQECWMPTSTTLLFDLTIKPAFLFALEVYTKNALKHVGYNEILQYTRYVLGRKTKCVVSQFGSTAFGNCECFNVTLQFVRDADVCPTSSHVRHHHFLISYLSYLFLTQRYHQLQCVIKIWHCSSSTTKIYFILTSQCVNCQSYRTWTNVPYLTYTIRVFRVYCIPLNV